MTFSELTNKTILIMGLLSFFGCSEKVELDNIYPYIITKDYLLKGVKEETVLIDTIVDNELYLTLVKDLKGLVDNVKTSDLKRDNISIRQASEAAFRNLDRLLKEQKIKATLFDGPDGLPFILFSDHWLSATAIFSTNIYSFSSEKLNTDTIFVSIPQRDAMILFPKCDKKGLADFKEMIKEKESDARKPLTFDIFQLDKNGFRKIE